MNEEIETVTPEQNSSTEANEATAAAAAFASKRGETSPAEPVDEVIEDIPVEPEPTPEPAKVLAGMTEDQIAELLGEIPKYRKQIDDVRGQNGKLNAAIQKLQQEAPRGEPVTVNDEDISEMRDAFPELAEMTKGAFNKILGRLNTRGTGPTQTPDDYLDLARKVATQVASNERVKTHVELLDGLHPGWNETIGRPDREGNIPETDYRKWLAVQPGEYQERIGNSNNAFEIVSSIKSFNEAQAASAKKQQQNKQRLANAVQPSGQVAARSTISEQSAAEKAFNARRQRG